MANTFRADLHGMQELVNQLRTLAPRLQKSALRKSARKAMNIVRDAARVNAKAIDDTETAAKIHKNIITQESRRGSKRVGGVMMVVGVKGGASRNAPTGGTSFSGGDTRHFMYVELGTNDTPATPFMRRALSENIQKVTEKFRAEFAAEIAKALLL